jgi:glycosyltransferase involved in cell wall biosynthesis
MSRKPRAIVSVTNDLYTDNRVNKICLFLVAQGYHVTLVGRLRNDSKPLHERSYRTKRFKLRWEKGPLFYAAYNFRLFCYLLANRAELLVSNDLDTLLANYAASKFKPMTRLVYDSHEYFTEVPELQNRPKIKKTWEAIENWIFPKLQTVYTVNESIAEFYRQKYKKEIRVVRNVSPKWKSTNGISKSELGIPENKFLIILQGAGINIDRGVEEAVEAMKMVDNAVLLIVGDGDVIEQLKKYVIDYDLQDSVLFFGKRPYAEMMNFTQYADVGLTLDKPTNMNYRFSLPNKVFDYIHAGTPIICTDLVEVSGIVKKYTIGLVLDELTPQHLADTINNLIAHPEEVTKFKENCYRAAEIENWEQETTLLEEIYPRVTEK